MVEMHTHKLAVKKPSLRIDSYNRSMNDISDFIKVCKFIRI